MDLSIVIPARNEIFLKQTVEDILKNTRGETEIIAVLDGYWPDPPVPDNSRVTLVHHTEPIGQRSATNEAVKLSKAKYIMKCDAHCSFDEGFDVKMMQEMHDDWTMVPAMKNLHAFDWVCKKCGDRRYQGVTPVACPKCDNTEHFYRDIVWKGKDNPLSTSYCFDATPHFQYFKEFKLRPEGKGDLTETMSLQGSCFMLTRQKYWELNVCDESFGSWGSQGIEVAVKTWLSGGRVVVNHKTWYAHMFRTKGGDFGFPYQISGRQIQSARQMAREIFFGNKLPNQKYQISWLLEKFWPIPGWTQEQLDDLKKQSDIRRSCVQEELPSPHGSPATLVSGSTKGIVYYTDNRCDSDLLSQCQEQLKKAAGDIRIVSVSLKPICFGENIVLPLERGYLTMFKQILAGIEKCDTDIIFLCEHDVLYTEQHFEFIPPDTERFFYNMHNWQIRAIDGHAVYWDCKKVSQICGYRPLMLGHYQARVEKVETVGFSRRMGFEPGTHNRPERVDDTKSGSWRTAIPNLDIRHAKNLTSSRWSPTEFRNPCKNWKESHVNKLPGWENLKL